jgi:hypothetical protein
VKHLPVKNLGKFFEAIFSACKNPACVRNKPADASPDTSPVFSIKRLGELAVPSELQISVDT